jgi:hypothetical protein
MRCVLISLVVMLCISAAASAETYHKIGPLDTLGDVKQRFPGAELERLTPAWAQEDDALFRISGPGLSGTIVVKFFDSRPGWRKDAESTDDPDFKQFAQKMADESDDAMSVHWVRWVPDQPIPLGRFVSKYGSPLEKGFAEDLQPYRTWTQRGLTAYLSDDERYVVRVDFEFTNAEHCEAWRVKHGDIPKFMEERCRSIVPSETSSAKPNKAKRR